CSRGHGGLGYGDHERDRSHRSRRQPFRATKFLAGVLADGEICAVGRILIMRILWLGVFFFAAQAMVMAQLDPDTLTVTVTRNTSLQPDQIRVGITVGAPVNATLDDVIAAVQGTGAGLANLTGVYTFQASGEEVAT